MRLENKTAIVTGAGGGIGSAIARAFAKHGANLVCVDIDDKTVGQTVDDITASNGSAIALIADIGKEEAAIRAVALAKETYGALNVLVSNAVYDLPFKPVTEISAQEWQATMDVNLNAAFYLSKHAIPAMADAGGGSIILVASQLGQVARPGRPWYCAQKGALISLARALAVDHARQNIRANSLSPGPVETSRYVNNFDSVEQARQNNFTLFDRLGQPDEIAPGAVFLASDESSFMTGADLVIDGGYTAL